MMITVGDRVKREGSGKVYWVRRITEEWILLEEEGGISQILTGKKNLDFSFEKCTEQEKSEREVSPAVVSNWKKKKRSTLIPV